MVEMHLAAVRVELPTNTPILLLQEAEGAHRTLPIYIGAAEATAIAYALQGVATARPMTHDLMRDLLEELGAVLDCVVITELRDNTFFAEMRLTLAGRRHTVSARPSDAIALAARMGTTIYAEEPSSTPRASCSRPRTSRSGPRSGRAGAPVPGVHRGDPARGLQPMRLAPTL